MDTAPGSRHRGADNINERGTVVPRVKNSHGESIFRNGLCLYCQCYGWSIVLRVSLNL